jgi:hypothetical protein
MEEEWGKPIALDTGDGEWKWEGIAKKGMKRIKMKGSTRRD